MDLFLVVNLIDEERNCLFKLNTIPVAVIIDGLFNALNGVVGSNLGGLECGFATHQAANKGGCVYIAGAVTGIAQAIMLVVLIVAVFHDYHAGLAGSIGNAGEDHILAAQSGQAADEGIDVAAVILGLKFHVGEEAGFGDVGHNKVSLAAKALHGLHIGIVKGGVELAVVSHGRVNHLQAAFGRHIPEEGGHKVDLLGTA